MTELNVEWILPKIKILNVNLKKKDDLQRHNWWNSAVLPD